MRLLSTQPSLSPSHTYLLLSTLSSTITDSQTPDKLEHSKLCLKHLYRACRVGEAGMLVEEQGGRGARSGGGWWQR